MNKYKFKLNDSIICKANYYKFGMEDGLLNKESAKFVNKENYESVFSKGLLNKISYKNGYYKGWMPFIYINEVKKPIGDDSFIVFFNDQKNVFTEEEFLKCFIAYEE